MPPQEHRVGARVPRKTKVGIVLRGDVVKDDSGSCAVFTEQGSSASQNDAGKKFCTLLPDYPGALDKQTTPYQLTPQVKMEDAPTFLKLPKSERADMWTRLPRDKWPETLQSIEELVRLL